MLDKRFVRTLLVSGLMLVCRQSLFAQEFERPELTTPSAETSAAAPYVQPTPPAVEATARPLYQQNAIARGQQRQARLASMAWYGMSNSRPTASATPFATMYSPAWQMPGGRPFAWHHYYAWPTTYVYYR
jgi:hypothetical protein